MTDQAHWAIILKQKIFWVGACSDWLLNPYVLLLRTCAYHLVRNVKKRTQALSKKSMNVAPFFMFIGPQPRPEGSYKIRSVLPSVCP